MREILDGEWDELHWIVHMRYEMKKKRKGKGTVPLLDKVSRSYLGIARIGFVSKFQ